MVLYLDRLADALVDVCAVLNFQDPSVGTVFELKSLFLVNIFIALTGSENLQKNDT